MTPFEIKNSLLKVFQRNVDVPKNQQFDGYYIWLGLQLDEIVDHCILTAPKSNAIKTVNKILFNPYKIFTGKERKSITAKLAKK